MSLANNGERSYRIFRFPWQGRPTWPPSIVIRPRDQATRLYFSYNGATELASYRVIAGIGFKPDTTIATVPRTRFEDSLDVTALSEQYCSFRVMPVDKQGRETLVSAIVYAPRCMSFGQYLPLTSAR